MKKERLHTPLWRLKTAALEAFREEAETIGAFMADRVMRRIKDEARDEVIREDVVSR